MPQGVSKENARTDAEHAQQRAHFLADPCPRHPNGGPTCWHNSTTDQLRDLGKALAVSPNITILEALLRGENVPIDQLDPDGLRRYGRRP